MLGVFVGILKPLSFSLVNSDVEEDGALAFRTVVASVIWIVYGFPGTRSDAITIESLVN